MKPNFNQTTIRHGLPYVTLLNTIAILAYHCSLKMEVVFPESSNGLFHRFDVFTIITHCRIGSYGNKSGLRVEVVQYAVKGLIRRT